MPIFHTKVDDDGKIQLPPQVLETLNLESGQDLDLEVERNTLRVSINTREKIRRAQAIVRKYVGAEVSLVDELIADRRREAEND